MERQAIASEPLATVSTVGNRVLSGCCSGGSIVLRSEDE